MYTHPLTSSPHSVLQTYQYQLKQCPLVNFEKLLVPWLYVICSLLFVLIILRGRRVILVMGGPLYHLQGDKVHDQYMYVEVMMSLLESKVKCTYQPLYSGTRRYVFRHRVTDIHITHTHPDIHMRHETI